MRKTLSEHRLCLTPGGSNEACVEIPNGFAEGSSTMVHGNGTLEQVPEQVPEQAPQVPAQLPVQATRAGSTADYSRVFGAGSCVSAMPPGHACSCIQCAHVCTDVTHCSKVLSLSHASPGVMLVCCVHVMWMCKHGKMLSR